MIISQFKHGLRFLIKHKTHAIINIIGFAIGICVFLLIGLYVVHEYTFDEFIDQYQQKARIEFGESPIMPAGVGHLLANSIPEIHQVCRTRYMGQATISYTPNTNSEISQNLNIYTRQFVDSVFFDFFTLEFVHGNSTNALKEPMSCVLSLKVSKKLFGEANPINKVIKVRNTNYRIDAVVKQPMNSHFQFDALFSISTLSNIYGEEFLTNFEWYNYLTYIHFNENYDYKAISQKIYHYLNNYDSEIFKDHRADIDNSDEIVSVRPLEEIYFFQDNEVLSMFSGMKHGNKQLVNLFSVIAIFILLIAIINFINLSTAKASTRIKEISVKKIVGAQGKNLRIQFLIESIIISFLAMLIAITLLQRLLPVFNNYFSKTIDLSQLFSAEGLAFIFGLTLLTGIISGLYPALYLSQTKLSKLLFDSRNQASSSYLFRRILIFFQFTITSSLIAGTLIISLQNNYLKNKKLGFEKENVVNLLFPNKISKVSDQFKTELQKNPSIKNVSFSHGIPGNTHNTMTLKWKETEARMKITSVDPEFFDLYKIKVKEGRSFDRNQQTDRQYTCLINETAAKLLGWDQIVGEHIKVEPGYLVSDHFTIIGIFEDYHVESLHNPIPPMAIFWNEDFHKQASIKLYEQDFQSGIKHIEETWKSFAPDSPFEYSFLTNRFSDMYDKEEKMHTIVSYFSALIIFIACLGLFGLASFMVLQKTKEIGIRKVFGASVSSIIIRLCKEYSSLIILASIGSIPIVVYLLNMWLSKYSYRINIPWWVFVISTLTSLIIANITVYFHSIKAANKNPVDAIRHE